PRAFTPPVERRTAGRGSGRLGQAPAFRAVQVVAPPDPRHGSAPRQPAVQSLAQLGQAVDVVEVGMPLAGVRIGGVERGQKTRADLALLSKVAASVHRGFLLAVTDGRRWRGSRFVADAEHPAGD